jgi:glycosyltransferase involved in cell wall biosynthesis
MAIYFYVYPSAFQNPGGGEVQLLKTKEALERRGVEVRLYDQWKDKLGSSDILHVFGSVKYCYGLMRTAKEAGTKVVLSTICWYDWRSALHTYPDLLQRSLNLLRQAAKAAFPWLPSLRKGMMEVSDLLLPNSEAEAEQLVRYFGISRNKIAVIPNAVDLTYEKGDSKPFVERYGLWDFYLCVGRIEPRKNQLALVRAHRGLERPLVVIGEAVSRYRAYEAACRQEAGPNVHFLGYLPFESELLRSAYSACNTFVLPSWFETPGLAALEAGLAGAKVVITDGGSTREYFGSEALYVNPNDVEDIRLKMRLAENQLKNGKLRSRIRENYLWEKVAEKVADCYARLQ